jgi:hypothetical protein
MLQKATPWAKGNSVPSMLRLSQPLVMNAANIIKKPFKADAAPAESGNGPTAPLCPMGWWMPWAKIIGYMANTKPVAVAASL